MSGHIVIEVPEQFAEYTDGKVQIIHVIYLPANELTIMHHKESRENPVYMKGTLKVHFVKQFVLKDEIVLMFYMRSISSEPIAEVKYSKIKRKSTCKVSKILELPRED